MKDTVEIGGHKLLMVHITNLVPLRGIGKTKNSMETTHSVG